MWSYTKAVQGDGLQTGFRPSKADNEAMPTDMTSKTCSDYICQAFIIYPSPPFRKIERLFIRNNYVF